MELQQYFNELAEKLANKEITCEQAIALFKVEENKKLTLPATPITDREQELLYTIQHLRDYIANDNIPDEDSDRLYQESLALADEALKNTHGEYRCFECDTILNGKIAHPFNAADEGEEEDICYTCDECYAAL